jgi:predicted aspartyl protease
MNFKKYFSILLLALCAVTLNCSAFRVIGLLNQGTYTKNIPSEMAGVHFRSIANLILVPVTFEKDATQYVFILDTGAGSTVIDSALCDSMKLMPQAEVMSCGGLGAAKREKVVVLPSFNVDRYSMKNIAAVSINLASINNATGIKISGIIGTNVLKHFKVFISYKNAVLKILDSTSSIPNADFSLPIKHSLSTSFLPVVSGTISFGMVSALKTGFEIDNGFNGWIMLPKSLVKQLNIPKSAMTETYGESMHDAYKGTNISLVRIPTITIGSMTLKNVPAFVADFKFRAIGKNILERFDWMLDYPANRISFFAVPDSAGMFFGSQPFGTGLIVEKNSKGTVIIKGIVKGSQADICGAKLGDKIATISGFSLDSLSPIDINNVLNEGLPADSVKLVMEKADGKQIAMTIGKSIFLGK